MESNERKVSLAQEAILSPAEEGEEKKTKEKEHKKVEGRLGVFLQNVFFGTMYALWGYILGGAALPFGTRPFGIALLSATDRRAFYVYAGLCLAAWRSETRLLWIGVYSAVLLIRLLVRLVLDTPWETKDGVKAGEKTIGEIYPLLFSEHISLRMATSCIGAFSVGIYRLIEGGFLFYDLYGTLLGVLVAPTAVLLFGGFFTTKQTGEARRLWSEIALAAALLFGVGDAKLYGVSLGIFGCMFFTLYVTKRSGMLWGMIAGMVGGLLLSPELSPMFAFAALTFGVFGGAFRALAIGAAASVGVAWSVYVSGLAVLNGPLAAILASSFLFGVVDKLFLSPSESAETSEAVFEASSASAESVEATLCLPLAEEELAGERLSETHDRIKELCESFRSLSEGFSALGKELLSPSAADYWQICESAVEASCASCHERPRCWEENYCRTASEIGGLSATLQSKGQVVRDDVDEKLRERCARIPEILEEINYHASLHQKALQAEDRTEIFALDYAALSDLLAMAMVKEGRDFEVDSAKTACLCETLNEMELPLEGACVFGTERHRILVSASSRELLERERARIRRIAEESLGLLLDEGRIRDEGIPSVLFLEREALRVSFAERTACAKGESEFCGDTVVAFGNREGRFYALVSDGMGSGREAGLTSGICGSFLKNLLSSGNSPETAIRMLNGFLRNRGGGSLHECSATVDLMELDLLGGSATFYKSGAAPTYVFRDGGLFKLRSRTVPIGIIQEPDTKTIRISLDEGDVIVMVSDGITQGKEECPWLFELLLGQGEDFSADRLADRIIKYAKGEGATDDLSVLVIKVDKA